MSNKLKLAAGATIDKAIEAIVKASASLGPDIHKWGVQAMMHAAEHGDARKVDRLFKGLHGANAPEAFKDWVMEYSPIRWNGDGEVGILKSTAKLFKPFNIEGANGNPYWNRIAVQKQPLTLDKLLKLISGMSKKIDKAEADDLIAPGESLATMRLLATRTLAAAEGAIREAAELQKKIDAEALAANANPPRRRRQRTPEALPETVAA